MFDSDANGHTNVTKNPKLTIKHVIFSKILENHLKLMFNAVFAQDLGCYTLNRAVQSCTGAQGLASDPMFMEYRGFTLFY